MCKRLTVRLVVGGSVLIHRVLIKNFRLLADVELVLEDETTVIVGRNNSGKTSLSEIMRRLLAEHGPTFQLEDFSSSCYDEFCAALHARIDGSGDEDIRALIPFIELRLICRYDPDQPQLGPLGPFVIDLDPAVRDAVVVIRYELKDGELATFFDGQPAEHLDEASKVAFFRTLRERIPEKYSVKVWAEDPNDPENRRLMQTSALRNLVKTGFINAQRGLDDITSRETDVLAKVLESLFTTASAPTADASERVIADALKVAVQDIQTQLDADFAGQLKGLIPTLKTFGYPGLGGQELQTETTLDVKKLLTNFTKVRYAGYGGVALPEAYNGLGVRNLIFILLQLVGFYRAFRAEKQEPGAHIIFIEEPEAHLHPQMQEVFIRRLSKIVQQLVGGGLEAAVWPVQFVVSTHSSHVANEAGFESIRYFLSTSVDEEGARQTKIKDLRVGLQGTSPDDKKFLHQYLTLTRCDLFFADKAVLVEGLSERLMLPIIISKLEEADDAAPKLSSQYMTVMEVGGAYAQLFFDLLQFLELRSLIVTDLDSVLVSGGQACAVHLGKATSNSCIKSWFAGVAPLTLADIVGKDDASKIKGRNRIAFQFAEIAGGPCGRTFEDAFILANAAMFGLEGATLQELELNAREVAGKWKKSEFALKYAIIDTTWTAPKYIRDGIQWLAAGEAPATDEALALVVEAAIPVMDAVMPAGVPAND